MCCPFLDIRETTDYFIFQQDSAPTHKARDYLLVPVETSDFAF